MDCLPTATIFGPMRLPFLILTPVCVVLGAATAVFSRSQVNLVYLSLVLIGSVSAHISVNALNEYHDFKSGLDFTTQPTPFSGGSGTLPKYPEKAHVALITGLVTLCLTVLIGIYFLFVRGLWLLPVLITGLITIVTYTTWLTKNPFICLIAPGLGFGPVMVMGTHFVLTSTYSWISFVASLVPFFLVSNLLLLNQFPDVEADSEIGRKHLPIAVGKEASVKIYGLFLVGAYIPIIFGWMSGIFPMTGLLGLASVALAVPTLRGVARFANDIPRLVPYMAKNVAITLLTPALLAIGLFISR
jgi:1,4-dihydroxy-2-naphthoate octaprenyltransferase